jgi:hypothetical protein
VSNRAKWAVGLAAGSLLTVAAVAPFLLMLLPNPLPVKVTDVAAQPPGAYIAIRSGTYHVFPRAEASDGFPKDALAADPGADVWVRYKELDAMRSYGIYSFPADREVHVSKTIARPGLLELRPVEPLPAGLYYAALSRDGIFGGTDFVYFRVSR